MPPIRLIYALHSGQLYGTERMALYTILALGPEFSPVVLAPAGPVHAECERLGIPAVLFATSREFARALRPFIAGAQSLIFFATSVVQSLACLGWNLVYRRTVAHLHMVHGGAEERLSYSRKRLLNGMPVRFVAVSHYVAERLHAHGVRKSKVTVIENFMTDAAAAAAPQHMASSMAGLRKLIVVSRLDPEKRVDVLVDAMEHSAQLRRFPVSIFGAGADKNLLQERVRNAQLPITLEGFCSDVPALLASADLLVHLCPVEPFGLAVLEAYAARVPVLVPSTGGAASLVEDGVSGFHFKANDPASLAAKILAIDRLPGEAVSHIVENASSLLRSRFSQSTGAARYRKLVREMLV
jgi:glycosyltransferase involved in cell wall biosynthesis